MILQEQGKAKDTNGAGQGDCSNNNLPAGMLALAGGNSSRGTGGANAAPGGDRFASFRGAVAQLQPVGRRDGGILRLTVPTEHQAERRGSDLRAVERLPGRTDDLSDDECQSPTKPGRKSPLGGGLGRRIDDTSDTEATPQFGHDGLGSTAA